MRVVVVGATGNVGTSLLASLGDDETIDSLLGVARRKPHITFPKTKWASADISRDDLVPLFEGADVVVHLAWLIQPSRDGATLRATNVEGSRRVFQAVADAGVPALVYASSIGTYSPGPKTGAITESWPVEGIRTSFYSRHKAEVEWMLNAFEEQHPQVRVVRLRPGLIFKREAATGIRRLFAGPLLPGSLLRRSLIPLVPNVPRLRTQVVHSYDVAEAYRLAVVGDVRGAFNIAADPILDADEVAGLLGARTFRIPARPLRWLAALTWALRLQPTPPGWVDLGLQSPLMDTTRAHEELGWKARYTAQEALLDLLAGLRDGADLDTPPLSRATTSPLRLKEFLTGVGKRV